MYQELTAEQIHPFLRYFTEMYLNGKEINTIPNNLKVTIYCESKDDSGFMTNVTTDEAGWNMLIAKSWILEEELQKLINKSKQK